MLFTVIACLAYAITPTKLSFVINTNVKTEFEILSPVYDTFTVNGAKQVNYDSFSGVAGGIMLVGKITTQKNATVKIHNFSSGEVLCTRKVTALVPWVITGDFYPYASTTGETAKFYITVTYDYTGS